MILYFKVYFLLTIMINLINMGISRKKRTSLFRNQVEKEWSEYYWKFLLKHPDKLNWEWISCNSNITMDLIEKNFDKYKLKDDITNLNNEQFIEIYKLLKKNNAKYNTNKNGIFFDLEILNDSMIFKLKEYIDFSKDNKKTLSNRQNL